MAVLPYYQKQGIGTLLLKNGLHTLTKTGNHPVFVLGHSNYYPKHGFVPASQKGFQTCYQIIETGMIKATKKYGDITIEFNPQFSTFEGHLFVFAFPKQLFKTIMKQLKLENKMNLIEFFTQENSVEDITKAISNGKVPFISTSEIRRPLKELIK